jgi:hypothetical protein
MVHLFNANTGFTTYNGLPELPAELNFDPVREKQVRNGVEVTGKYWVINPLTDAVIGDGKTVHNPQNFNRMWETLRASTVSFTGQWCCNVSRHCA